MADAERPQRRTNGFERPFHPLQILSWVVFGSDAAIFSFCVITLIDSPVAQGVIGTSYAFSVLIVLLATIRTTRRDPVDPHAIEPEQKLCGQSSETLFCSKCAMRVYNRSKHCFSCKKCVDVFDHHCMWLNTCIGKANYKGFIWTISSVAVMLIIVLSSTFYVLADFFQNEEVFEDRMQKFSMPKEVVLSLLVVLCFINVPLLLLDMQLVFLHAFLRSQGLTTYEYIVKKGKLQAEREIQKKQGSNKALTTSSGLRFKALPRCMDWILFARCGKKRHKKSKCAVEPVKADVDSANAVNTAKDADTSVNSPEKDSAGTEGSQAGQGDVAASTRSPSLSSGQRSLPSDARAPTPSGSTHDPLVSDDATVAKPHGSNAAQAMTSASAVPPVAAATTCSGHDPSSDALLSAPAMPLAIAATASLGRGDAEAGTSAPTVPLAVLAASNDRSEAEAHTDPPAVLVEPVTSASTGQHSVAAVSNGRDALEVATSTPATPIAMEVAASGERNPAEYAASAPAMPPAGQCSPLRLPPITVAATATNVRDAAESVTLPPTVPPMSHGTLPPLPPLAAATTMSKELDAAEAATDALAVAPAAQTTPPSLLPLAVATPASEVDAAEIATHMSAMPREEEMKSTASGHCLSLRDGAATGPDGASPPAQTAVQEEQDGRVAEEPPETHH